MVEGGRRRRAGPRWSILSMLCPVHPFPLRGNSPRWEACHWIFRSLRSLTNPVPLPPQGETRKYVALDIVSHMTQTANPVTLLASPLGEEGHEVAKGCTRVRMIMILDVDVTAEGGIIKLIARRAIPPPSAPQALSPPERSEPQPFYTTCGASRAPFLKLAAKPPPLPSEPGPRSGPSSRPLPSRCARHPPPGKGVGR